jgi:RimJ/RimL family protein N-acetyltransferase
MPSNHTIRYQLKSDRLILTEVAAEDLNEIHALHSMPEVDKYNTLGIPENIQETKDFLEKIIKDQHSQDRKQICWTIREVFSNDFIGIAGLIFFAKRFKMAEIYFKLFPVYWGKGYATELARRIFKFAFQDLKLHRIEAGVATENVKSIRVLEKLGMTREGSRRKILPIRGKWKDNFHYAILEEEFEK